MDINNKEKERMYTDKILPLTELEKQWIMDITVNYFGINQRVVNLLKELNETPYRQEVVTEKMREIALNDLWFYKSHPEADNAIRFIISLFHTILHKGLNYQNKKRFLDTLSEFIKSLYDEKSEEIDYESISENLVIFLEDIIYIDKELKIYASSFFKKIPDKISHDDIHLNRLKIIIRAALRENLFLWQKILNYANWCTKKDSQFFKKYKDIILKISQTERDVINRTKEELIKAESWKDFSDIYGFEDFINEMYTIKAVNRTSLELIYYIFYLLEMPELIGLQKPFLNELAYSFKALQPKSFDNINLNHFLSQLFLILNQLKEKNTGIIIEGLLNLGEKVYQTKNKVKIKIFNKYLIGFGFVFPGKIQINQDWQIEVNSNHIKMIRLYLELIKCSPKDSTELIKALIVNLKIGGLFVQDNDLFQRDISQLLASDIEPNYFFIKQLASLFPVYYNDIGAEGEIREISTKIDKISDGSDRLIHFLRKQVHSESNNAHIELTKNIFHFWYDGNVNPLKKVLPENVQAKLTVSGKWFDPVHQIVKKICSRINVEPGLLLEQDIDIIKRNIKELNNNDQTNKKRVLYLIELYQLLKHKYTLSPKFIINDLKKSKIFTLREVEYLQKKIKSKQYILTIKKIYHMLYHLKEVILRSEKTEAHESIYYKRHIAPGIPSMYGQYSEKKFEAMGLIFRLERLADYFISKIISERNLNYMSIDGFHNAAKILELFKKGLEINGISNENFNSNLEMLNYSFKTTTFSMNQFINLFYFITQNIKEIIDSYYIEPFNPILKVVVKQCLNGGNNSNANFEYCVYMKSEEFYRDIIVSGFLVQNIDNYISKILVTLRSMVESLQSDVIQMLLNYNPKLLSTSFYKSTPKVDNQIFLGAKAYYLKKLYSYKFPVPPGFVLTTEWFRDRKAISQFPEMYKAILQKIRENISELEKITGKNYGDPKNPLLLAVRSGTVISMPGAMDSILNIGMNDEIAESLSKMHGYKWAAWDSYRRLLQNWGMAYGIVRDEFDKIILDYKKIYRVEEKKLFSNEQMRTIAYAYKDLLSKYGIKLEEDLFQQLIQAAICVFQSWYNDRAQVFRKKLQIAEEWGTAVIVQEMVLGNIGDDSGTGVVFTRIPFDKNSEVALYGDYNRCSQGEDIVSGLVYTLPISEVQSKKFPHLKGNSLEKQFPEIYQELLRLAKELIYKYGYDHQEIEFTFKSKNKKDLYILQTRRYTLKEQEKVPVFIDPLIHIHLVGTGIGIGAGAINGLVAFDLEDMKYLTRKYPHENKILIRPDTVPDDIEMIFDCDGLLTARGGVTSHAAVAAVQLGKICVVNCKQMVVIEGEKKCTINHVVFHTGDEISIDASLGNIYKGKHSVSREQIDYLNEKKI
jgi:pyruvate, orthophosphate dikinase